MPKRSIAQPSAPIALGMPQLAEGIDAWFIKAVLVEFLATLLFLFISISTAGRLGDWPPLCTAPWPRLLVLLLSALRASPSEHGVAVSVRCSRAVNSCEAGDTRVPMSKDATLTDCTLTTGRILLIAFAFGVSIFVFVYAAAPFRRVPSVLVCLTLCSW